MDGRSCEGRKKEGGKGRREEEGPERDAYDEKRCKEQRKNQFSVWKRRGGVEGDPRSDLPLRREKREKRGG